MRLFAKSYLILMLALTACAPISETRGTLVANEDIAQLKPGQKTKRDVQLLLGSPSTVSTFEDNIWFYIGQRHETIAFFAPNVVEHQVLALSFDKQGLLDAVVRRGGSAYRDIQPINDATPTAGKQLTFLEQLVGNVGRFNKEQ